jgi:hypothetical protein
MGRPEEGQEDEDRRTAPPEPGPPAPWTRRRRWELLALLELAGLCGLAITQPLLDLIGRSPDFLLMERVDTLDVVLLALAIALVPPVLLWLVGAAGGLAGGRWRRVVHVALVGGLLAALAMQVGKQLSPVRGLPLAVAAVVCGLAGTALYLRIRVLGKVLRVASVGPLLSAALFLFVSPASALVLPQSTPAPQAGPATGAARRPPIVVFALDELPLASLLDTQGHIDASNFPNLAWLAERSTWYRNATGTTQWIRDAFPSMLVAEPATDAADHGISLAPGTAAASSATATTSGSGGCRCSSRSPASTPPRSTTATGSTSTCCPPCRPRRRAPALAGGRPLGPAGRAADRDGQAVRGRP